ncbi:MAG: hypothetical protein AAB554_05755 [Patescibacteria group bacterium]
MGLEKLFARFVVRTDPDDRKLYLSSVLWSVFHLSLMWHAYLRLHHSPPYAFVIVHMVFVGVLYALPKEIHRWHDGSKPPSPKAGHLLVLAWLVSITLMGLGEQFIDAKEYKIPDGMTEMTGFLLATLGVTHTSKQKHALKHPPCPPREETSDSAAAPPKTPKPPQ